MNNNKLNLDVNRILEKEFSVDLRGYNPQEVDSFLDVVAEDYELFAKVMVQSLQKIKELEQVNESLRKTILDLEKNDVINKYEAELLESKGSTDILKRVSALEKEVFGKQR